MTEREPYPFESPPLEARILDVEPAEYHDDPCPAPSLSQSIAKVLLTKTPLHAWAAHPKLGGAKRPSRPKKSAAFDRGTVVHKLVLGRGADFEEIHFKNYTTKKAKAARDAAYDAGLTPILSHQLAGAVRMKDETLRVLDDQGIVLDGESEVAIAWQELTSNGVIWCRGMLDHVWLDRGEILDLKNLASADGEDVGKACVTNGYDIQRAAYVSALRRLTPELAGRIKYRLAVVEPAWPHATLVSDMPGVLARYGEMRWAKACETWGFCVEREVWSGYQGHAIRVPGWLESRILEGV